MVLHPGALLGLTAEQAAARSFGLVQQGAQWRVVRPVGFKAGEMIEHVGELPKALAQAVEPVVGTVVGVQPAAAPAADAQRAARKAAPRART